MYKRCTKCNIEKDIGRFSKAANSKDGLRYWCKDCCKEGSKKYNATEAGRKSNHKKSNKYRQNNLEFCRKLGRANSQRIIEENRQWINSLKYIPCSICGNSYAPECMDFDHINPDEKKFEIGELLWKTYKRERIEAELKKCRIICCYCHADITHKNRPINKNKYVRAKREKIDALKDFPCAICNIKYEPWKMQFDHLNANKKIDCVSNLIARASINVVLEEIKKCQLLCIGCHRIITKSRCSI